MPALHSLLAERAATHSEEPWLFFRHDLHWRWLSWGQVADQVARGAAVLAGADGLGDRPLAFACDPPVAAVAVDLALAAAGLAGRAWPGEVGDARRRAERSGFGGWIEVEAEDPPPATFTSSLPTFTLPAARSRLRHWQPQTLAIDPPPREDDFTPWIRWHELLPPASERVIAHCGVGLEEPSARSLVAWSLLTGAALALPSPPGELLPDVLWTRPHLVLAPAAELSLLAVALKEQARARHRRLLAVVASDQVEDGLAADWTTLGVALLPPPPELAGVPLPPARPG